MRELLLILKALSDQNRLRIVCALAGGERCVCQIVELLGLSAATVSQHLSLLHGARLVESRKQGRWMYYRLPESATSSTDVREALEWVMRALETEPLILSDDERLGEILSFAPEEVTRRQAQGVPCCSPSPGKSCC